VATLLLLPKLGSYIFGFLLRTLGWSIQTRTKDRREAILARVRADRKDFDSKQTNRTSRGSEDDEWEKVDKAAPGTPTKGKSAEDDWDGIVGFFHPFWYGY
jgi:alpha-1,2-mannosyltransferase